MSPMLFEMDLLERRRRQHWHRLARPDQRPPAIDSEPAAHEPFTPGYPRHHLLARALLPLALAILLFLVNHASRSNAANPRGTASAELRQ